MKLSTISKRSVCGSFTNAFIVALGISCHSVLADSISEESSWSAGLYLAPIGMTQKSQLSVDHKSMRTADLNHLSNTSSVFSAFPSVLLDCTPSGSQTSLFFGCTQASMTEGQLAMELGLVHLLSKDNKATVEMCPELSFFGGTWKDTFSTGKDRQKPKVRSLGRRIKFEHSAFCALDVQYAVAKNSLDEKEPAIYSPQLSSQLPSMLNRTAEHHRLNLNMNSHFGQSIIIVPVLQVTKGEDQGDANNFAEGTFILQSLFMTAPYSFSAAVRTFRMGSRVYGPVFKTPPNSRELSLNAVDKYAEPRGHKNLSMLSMVM